jgi:hypothetical protein
MFQVKPDLWYVLGIIAFLSLAVAVLFFMAYRYDKGKGRK